MWQDYTISASVGLGGKNRPDDVGTIQILLNRIPLQSGGPATPLVTDGKSGPKTETAIKNFQTHHALAVIDSKVDPGGNTLKKINALLEAQILPEEPTLVVPPALPRTNKLANIVVIGIWGWRGDGIPGDPSAGIVNGIEKIRTELKKVGFVDAEQEEKSKVWSTSWNPTFNSFPFVNPATQTHLDDLYGREPNPTYVALIGHSLGGFAACRLSNTLNRPPDYVALLDPVFGVHGQSSPTVLPRGARVHSWYQDNAAFVVTKVEECSGNLLAGISLFYGREIENAENPMQKVIHQMDAQGNPLKREDTCADGTHANRFITHADIDSDQYLWNTIIKQILSDVAGLER
ncbi:MAG: peptidoglycan-binding protein [Anaerolineae bacterium]|nr:peptidoglycan-binding protein [Anaerolineae bacterium]